MTNAIVVIHVDFTTPGQGALSSIAQLCNILRW